MYFLSIFNIFINLVAEKVRIQKNGHFIEPLSGYLRSKMRVKRDQGYLFHVASKMLCIYFVPIYHL